MNYSTYQIEMTHGCFMLSTQYNGNVHCGTNKRRSTVQEVA